MEHNANSADLTVRARRLNLDLDQLRLAVAAADFGSFRQAAESFSMAQSSFSRSILLLEHALGITIFERSTAGVRATPAGRHFLRTARPILEQMDMLVAKPKATDHGEGDRLTIGFCTSLTTGHLRATLLEHRLRFPQVALGTVERSRTRLVTALRNGAIDLYIVAGDVIDVASRSAPLWSERVFVALPPDHPLAELDVISCDDLENQSILISQYDPGRELEALLNAKLATSREAPRIEHRDVSRGEIKNLVSMGLGISLVLESDVDANSPDVVYRELRDCLESRICFSAVWREGNKNPALAKFLQLLAERYPLSSVA
ncbi:LysR family transcriptional regulator [Bradyrhizobium neotropicale]|uniref:LysR family transcriptional regulator n=1 Tax=Bradyrhizobium neotropicale TaxID=1497615 RepID=A0A176ZK30_9BRAD|nr:LysR family transcriptional regulator [Bradyrhizobium neotropicale]OAF20195.1 LysR family transcriptional regulator [Bradyrhizobium neotropicale]